MKKEYFNFREILFRKNEILNFKLLPKGTGEVIAEIKYLLKRYLHNGELQHLISKYDFFKYHDYIEEELKNIIPLYTVKIIYPFVLIKSVYDDYYVKAIIFHSSYKAFGLYEYCKWLDENRK